MKKTVFLLALLSLSACITAPQQAAPTVPVEFTIVPTLVIDETLDADEALPSYAPQPGDSALTKARVMTNKVYVPFGDPDTNQILLHISGYLPTPCHELRIIVPAPDANGDVYVEAYALAEADLRCEQQVLRAYDVTVDMGSYPSGSYWVYMNGGQVGNFDF